MRTFLRCFIYSLLIFSTLLLPLSWLWKVAIILLLLYIMHVTNVRGLFKKKNNCIRLFFGTPGAGKTTFAAFLSHLRHTQGVKVLSNVDIADTYILDPIKDLGTYTTYFDGEGCTVIIDEASLDFDNRGFKSFSDSNRNFFCLFRHDCTEIFAFSQSLDTDKKIRDRASSCYYLQKSLIPGCISIRKIKKIIDITEEKQLVDGFEFVKFSRRILWARPYWKYFDTLDRNLCCKKEKTWLPWRSNMEPLTPSEAPSSDKNQTTDEPATFNVDIKF